MSGTQFARDSNSKKLGGNRNNIHLRGQEYDESLKRRGENETEDVWWG